MTSLIKFTLKSFVFLILVGCSTTEGSNKYDFATYPVWVRDATFYQIFPERFNNGDTYNDPTIEDGKGSWPHDPVKEWSVSPWTSDWYKLQPWEENNERGFYYNAQLRRYGGDIQGIINKLDYLKELGITAIYLNPIFESPSLHKYDAMYYHHIDDNFGPNPLKDRQIIDSENPADPATWMWTTADSLFLDLLNKAHDKGIRIIIDGVFNHVGLRFWAFEDVKKNGKNSKYINWFTIKKWDDPTTAEDEFDYECWFGARTLPELREDENGIVSGPREHIFTIVRRWMDPNGDGDPSDGIDGWRLDVAEKVSHEFWKEFRIVVKSINPQAYIVAELFWDDWNNKKLMDPTPWLQGDQFDGVMNYQWGSAVLESFINPNTENAMLKFKDEITKIFNSNYDTLNYIQLNLYDSHDTERLITHIINPTIYLDTYVSANNNENYKLRKPTSSEIEKQKLLALIQMTFVGAPMIYYGDEAGMWGADDPDERKPMVWPEYKYENESHHPFNKERTDDSVIFNTDLFEFYKQIINMRNKYDILRRGNWIPVIINNDNNIFVFKRIYKSIECFIAVNNSDKEQDISIELPGSYKNTVFMNLLNEKKIIQSENNLKFKLQPVSGAVLLKQ